MNSTYFISHNSLSFSHSNLQAPSFTLQPPSSKFLTLKPPSHTPTSKVQALILSSTILNPSQISILVATR